VFALEEVMPFEVDVVSDIALAFARLRGNPMVFRRPTIPGTAPFEYVPLQRFYQDVPVNEMYL
jgi:hypothetical protein